MLALVTTASLTAPATALASFAKTDSAGKLTYTGTIGEANNLAVTSGGAGEVQLAESGRLGILPVLIAGTGGCSGLSAHITCRGVASATVNAGDGNDRVSARDGQRERITCGSGTDTVVADADDSVASDCESVDKPAETGPVEPTPGNRAGGGSAQPGGGGGNAAPSAGTQGDLALGPANPFVNIVPPRIPAQAVKVTRSGVAAVRVVCPAGAGACSGTVALVLVGRAGHARIVAAAKARRGITLGRTKFTAKAGEKPFVQVRLNRRGRRRILRQRHTRCYMVVKSRSARGKVVTTRRAVTLRLRRGVRHPRKARRR